MREPSTRRGRDTRRRIIAMAAELMYEHGVGATSVEDVLAASGTGKSQFYHYFSSREDLLTAVLDHQVEQILEEQRSFELDTWAGIEGWLQALARRHEAERGLRGCPLGSIVSEVLDNSDRLRSRGADAFARWESALADGLRSMQNAGLLRAEADPAALAEVTIAILQGGYLLSSTKRQAAPMRNTVTAALAHLRSLAPSAPNRQG
ncbi:MAG: TetR/AcrR family transcriptional regulator [Actinomycetota bacterium]|nr:TetR/AcrR family transcriptional regulator [Actinomycetota bacterium]